LLHPKATALVSAHALSPSAGKGAPRALADAVREITGVLGIELLVANAEGAWA
jgi:hypothetical protein